MSGLVMRSLHRAGGDIVGEWIDDELKCINARYCRLSLIRSLDPR